MDGIIIAFWACVLLVVYTYVVYPLAIWLVASVRRCPVKPKGTIPATVSFVMAARNEGARIAERIEELKQQLDSAGVEGEVLVVLDGPEDSDALVEQMAADRRVQVLTLPRNQGKAAAISEGAKQAKYEILALADVRQRWQDDALKRLLENFCDPQVGAVSGDLVLQANQGVAEGVGLYWRYEKWLRRNEALVDSVVGVTGSISAVRRELFDGVPAGTILDDVYWPLKVVMRGYRVQHDHRARAFDRLPERARDEFRRKIRTLCGSFQLVTWLPTALVPWKNRTWWQFLSHKLMRLAVPWLLLGAFAASGAIDGSVYRWLFWGQVGLYSLLLLGIATGTAGRHRVSSAAASFAMLNVAAWLAFWVWVSGNGSKSWSVARYSDEE